MRHLANSMAEKQLKTADELKSMAMKALGMT
jgi:hypothetical protein